MNADAAVPGPPLWRTAAWRDEATAWIDASLAAVGRARTGEVEQPRIRPWATLLCAAADEGCVWFKAMAPGTDAEAPLYEILARAAPEHVLAPIAVDAGRGWVLLPDGGKSLAGSEDGPKLLQGMADALPAYAALQLRVAPYVDAMLAAGVADMRAAAMPERFEQAIAATAEWANRAGGGDDARVYAALEARRDDVARDAAALAAAPIEPTVDHNDLHFGNVLVGGDAVRFYDWGDSVIAHPFASVLVPMTVVRDSTLRCTDDDPRLTGLRNAYLQPFADVEGCTTADLVPTLELACRMAKIARALTWQRAIDATEPDDPSLTSWAQAPFAALRSLLDPSPYGGA